MNLSHLMPKLFAKDHSKYIENEELDENFTYEIETPSDEDHVPK